MTCPAFYFVFQASKCRFLFYAIIEGIPQKASLNDMDSTPYDTVFAFGSLQRFFFLRSFFTHFSRRIPMKSMDSCYLMTCIFQLSAFVDFLREWYSCCYAVEVSGTMNRNHCKVSLMHVYLHDLFSYLYFYCRIAISKGNS